MIYAGSTAEVLIAIDAETGQTRWRASSNLGSFTTFLSCEESAVYGIHPGGQIEVYDGRTGRLKWSVTESFASLSGSESIRTAYIWAPCTGCTPCERTETS